MTDRLHRPPRLALLPVAPTGLTATVAVTPTEGAGSELKAISSNIDL